MRSRADLVKAGDRVVWFGGVARVATVRAVVEMVIVFTDKDGVEQSEALRWSPGEMVNMVEMCGVTEEGGILDV